MVSSPKLLSRSIDNFTQFLRWIALSTMVGLVVGLISILFNFGMKNATQLREAHPWILLFLPVAGLIIVALYRFFNYENNGGTDTVIECIQSETYIPLQMAFLIFVSSILTVFCGGSVGREGAAVQIGGSIGKSLGDWLHFDKKDRRVLLMSGVSAAFSALFSTPMAAAFLPMEMADVGFLYYPALVPCIWASFVAYFLARAMHAPAEQLTVAENVELTLPLFLQILLLGILCALVSILFCEALYLSHSLYKTYLKNSYVRIVTGGFLIIGLTLLLRTTAYLGPGMDVIDQFLHGQVIPWAFLLKILFTAITIGAGYKGGEIVPSFFTGAAFGALFGSLFHGNIPLCAAAGMGAVFCGVTNCPVTALLICFELFGFSHAPYYLIAIAVSYMLSGHYSLYRTQRILYPKVERVQQEHTGR